MLPFLLVFGVRPPAKTATEKVLLVFSKGTPKALLLVFALEGVSVPLVEVAGAAVMVGGLPGLEVLLLEAAPQHHVLKRVQLNRHLRSVKALCAVTSRPFLTILGRVSPLIR